jgi:hypothetical protein
MSGNDRCVRAKRVGRRREEDYRGPWVSQLIVATESGTEREHPDYTEPGLATKLGIGRTALIGGAGFVLAG